MSCSGIHMAHSFYSIRLIAINCIINTSLVFTAINIRAPVESVNSNYGLAGRFCNNGTNGKI